MKLGLQTCIHRALQQRLSPKSGTILPYSSPPSLQKWAWSIITCTMVTFGYLLIFVCLCDLILLQCSRIEVWSCPVISLLIQAIIGGLVYHCVKYLRVYSGPPKCNTVEPPNEGHFGISDFVLYWEVVLFSEVKNEWLQGERGPEVSFVGRLSLSQRVLYRRFHCTIEISPLKVGHLDTISKSQNVRIWGFTHMWKCYLPSESCLGYFVLSYHIVLLSLFSCSEQLQ